MTMRKATGPGLGLRRQGLGTCLGTRQPGALAAAIGAAWPGYINISLPGLPVTSSSLSHWQGCTVCNVESWYPTISHIIFKY